jgi:hypothetical protein
MTGANEYDADGGNLIKQATYKYDAFGNLIEEDVDPDGAGPSGTTTTRFAYDGSNVWADMDLTSSPTASISILSIPCSPASPVTARPPGICRTAWARSGK